MDVRAGIFWDPREPPPPGVVAALDGTPGFGGHHARRYTPVQAYRDNGFYRRPPHRSQPKPQPQPELYGGWDEVPIPKAEKNNLPPLSVSVTAQVVQDTAKVTVTQLFWNTNESISKAAYTFPLSAGCTVTSFSCRIGTNKIVKAKVQSKPEARDAFNEALRNNQSAGLLEQGTPEVFTTTLGNIPANTKLRTEITYVTLLKHKFADNCNTITLTIPTNIAPRYGSPPPELENTPIPGLSPGISIQVNVTAEKTAHKISSKSHRITIEPGIGRNLYNKWAEFARADGANDAEVSLVKLEDGRAFLDKDFVLNIAREQQDGLETPTAWLEIHPTLANHMALMLTIPPNFMLRNQESNPDGEIIFLADQSGSMSDKMESLKSAMNFFLKGIPQGRKFNIWCFGSDYTSLWPQSVDYSKESLQEAMAYVSRQFDSDMGGTEILGALKAIVRARNHGSRMVDIVMLTDGEVWELNETLSFVQDTSQSSEGRIRFFALGIGNAVSHELVEGIAKAGGGYAEVVPAASQGGWEDRVVAMLGAALTGHVRRFQIDFDGQREDHALGIPLGDWNCSQGATGLTRPGILQSPAGISTLSPFLSNRAFMLFDSAREHPPLNHINIKVTAPGGEEIITRVPISLVEKKDSTLHNLAARALLGDLERGQSWIHLDPYAPPRGSAEEQELVRQEGEALGCKWSLVSKWTSFYAVEEPYHAAQNEQTLFLDTEDMQIREAVDDLDLLRPRGVATQQANLLAVPLPAAFGAVEANDGPDHDKDTASHLENTDMGSDVDEASHSDDGGKAGDGGDAAAYQMGDNADQQRHDPGDGDATRGNSDTQNDATFPNLPPFLASDPDYGSSYTSFFSLGCRGEVEDFIDLGFEEPQSIPPEGTNNTIPYNDPVAKFSAHSSFRIHRRDAGSSARKRARSPSPSHGRLLAKFDSRIDINLDPSGNLVFEHSEQTSGHPTLQHRDHGTAPSLGNNAALRVSPWGSSPAFGNTPQSQSPDYAAHPSQTETNYSGGTYLTHQTPYFQYVPSSQLSAEPSTAGRGDPPQSSAPSVSIPRYGGGRRRGSPASAQNLSIRMDYEDISPPARSQTPAIIAPSFNIPASTAMLSSESRTPRSEQEIASEQFIKKLLGFQSFDGSFNFDSHEQLKTHLGPDFASVVQDLQHEEADFKLAVTVALILLLNTKFRCSRALWTLVIVKARDYVRTQQPLQSQRVFLYRSARQKVLALDVSQILQLAAPAQLEVLPPAREQISQKLREIMEGLDELNREPGIGRLNAGSLEESGTAVRNEGSANRVVLDTAPIED